MTSNKRFSIVIGSALIVVLVAAVIYLGSKPNTPASNRQSTALLDQVQANRATVEGDLAKLYTTLDELVADAQVVALGQFEGQPALISPRTTTPPFDPGRRELTFLPSIVLKGAGQVNVGDKIQIAQRAAVINNEVKATAGDSLFQPQDIYIVFLTPALPEEGKFYWVTGAVQGALRVTGDRVYSRNVIGEIPHGIGPKVEGQPLDSIITMLRDKDSRK